jgi:hypothetical protein
MKTIKRIPLMMLPSCLMLALLLWLFPALTYAETVVEAWVQRYSAPSENVDEAGKVVCDDDGNVIVAGYTDGGISGRDMLIIKYSSAGVPLWTNRYNGPGNDGDYASAVAVDGSNNVIVTVYSDSGGGNYDYATIKYSSAGAPLWTNRYNGPANGDDRPGTRSCLAIGLDGAVVVTGASDGDFSSSMIYDFATVKYISVSPPVIADQPSSRTNNMGTTALFSVTATGTEPLTYLWQKNGSALSDGGKVSGATTATLTLNNVSTNEAGSYSVVVTNVAGSVTSSNAVLTVTPVLHFDTSPSGLRWTTNGFLLTVVDLLGQGAVTIYASTNLIDWEGLLTNPPTTGTWQFIDTEATNWDKRFYRASEQY